MRRTLLSLALLVASPAAAFDLALPAACTLGEDCYLQNLFDHDPGPDSRDAACGPLAYDGHDGTDIAVPTLAAQARGVDVLAAAPGIVAGLRDGMPDEVQGQPDSPDVSDVECGNGVLLRHADGWDTQYCHMAQGSITVAEGQEVAAGDVLGRVGYSGNAEFPHLHLTVRKGGVAVDPFAPEASGTCGDLPEAGLWSEPLPFPAGGLTGMGFATSVPEWGAVRAGTAATSPAPGEPLVLFGLFYGGRAGDEVRLQITGPDGAEVLDHAEPLDRKQALLFRAAGLRAPSGGWPAGRYEGTATLLREGEEMDSMAVTSEMPGG